MAMDFQQASEQLAGLQQLAPSALDQSLSQVAQAAVPELESTTPVRTGHLRDSWTVEGTDIINTARYAEFALDSVEVGRVIARFDERWADDIEQRLTPHGG